jgi:hypothetical protein
MTMDSSQDIPSLSSFPSLRHLHIYRQYAIIPLSKDFLMQGNTPRALISFPKHALSRNRKIVILYLRINSLFITLRLHVVFRGYDSVMTRTEGWAGDLNLAFGALNPHGRVRRKVAVRVGGDAEVGKCNAMGCLLASRCGGECEDHRGFLVGTCVVLCYGGNDGGWFSLGDWHGVVDALEAPCEWIDPDWGFNSVSSHFRFLEK